MTFDEYYRLIDKYGIEVDADLFLKFRNYLLGKIETDPYNEDTNHHVTFATYDYNGKLMKWLNPIAVDNLLKNRILDIKKQEVIDREKNLNEDFE